MSVAPILHFKKKLGTRCRPSEDPNSQAAHVTRRRVLVLASFYAHTHRCA